ncbi:hypothetical protein [Parvularcula oceani]|nr:hypothetical protein [Parvularcula oceani]
MADRNDDGPRRPEPKSKEERLAEQLRRNLRRRKAAKPPREER